MPPTDNRGLGGRPGERTLPQNVILSNPPGAASFDEVLGAFEHSLYNFVGLFALDLRRRPPFRFRVAS